MVYVETLIAFIQVFAIIGIIAIYTVWIMDHQEFYDNAKAILPFIAPPVAAFGLIIGFGYSSPLGIIIVAFLTTVSALLFDIMEKRKNLLISDKEDVGMETKF